jgi:hypothetical protein
MRSEISRMSILVAIEVVQARMVIVCTRRVEDKQKTDMDLEVGLRKLAANG